MAEELYKASGVDSNIPTIYQPHSLKFIIGRFSTFLIISFHF